MDNAILVFFGAVLVILVGFLLRYRKEAVEFVADVRQEMTKVTWPDQQEITNSTVMVIVVTIILTLATGVLDKIIGGGMSLIMKAFL